MNSNGRREQLLSLLAILVIAAVFTCRTSAVRERVRRVERSRAIRALQQANVSDLGYISRYRFRFSPIERQRGGYDDESIRQAAYAVFSTTRGDFSVEAHHDRGIASLLLGDRSAAIEHLRIAVKGGSAETWNDLAVAYRDLARTDDAPWKLPIALTCVDHALGVDPRFAPSLYNRALLLDDLGINTEASNAWRAFLAIEPASEAADSARRHLAADDLQSDTQWKECLPALRAAAARQNLDTIREAVRRFPQQARTWGETEFLFDWATATRGGDPSSASMHFSLARDVGSALRERTGESMLWDVTESIAVAIREHDSKRVSLLADAHIVYRMARLELYQHRASEAFRDLEEAARMFGNGHSAMAIVASYYITNALAESGRTDDAIHKLKEVAAIAALNRSRHLALTAQIDWEIGLCEGLRGHWDESLPALERSASTFRRLGEQRNEGSVRSMIAECSDLLGDPHRGWRERVAASRLLSVAGDSYALATASAASTFALIYTKEWEEARSLSLIDSAIAASSKSPLFVARAWMRRALIATELRDELAFQEALIQARLTASSMTDQSLAGRTLADIDVVEAKAVLKIRPEDSVHLVGNALHVYESAGLDAYLPDLLALRARAFSELEDDSSAWKDLARGMNLIEGQRQRIPQEDLRTGIFDQSISLFDDAIRIALRRNDYEAAFYASERARARTLLDELSPDTARLAIPGAMDVSTIRRSIDDRVLVEFAVLPEELVVFAVTRDGLSVFQQPIRTEELSSMVERFIDDAIAYRDIQHIATQLFTLLLGDMPSIEGHTGIVVVPDRCLLRLPFAALIDPHSHRYLIECIPITFAPSAAVHIACSRDAERLASARPSTILAVGDPAFDESRFRLARLNGGRAEASDVAAIYARAHLLTAHDATRERFITEAVECSVIHYAGHAVINNAQPARSFLLFAPESISNDGILYASDIARMRFDRTCLVVVAACSSSADRTKGREGSLTVSRAFLAAGVPATIGTLWDIDDDASTQLFSALHRYVAAGASPEKALQSAQLEMIRDRGAAIRPAQWASVIITGGLASATRGR